MKTLSSNVKQQILHQINHKNIYSSFSVVNIPLPEYPTTNLSVSQTVVNGTNNVIENEEQKYSTEINGPKGKEPTRYGDWERNGRTIDF